MAHGGFSWPKVALLFVMALGMTLPGALWREHVLSHSGAQVGASEHHHHDVDTGAVERHENHSGDRSSGNDGGHDHMPGLFASSFALVSADVPVAAPFAAKPAYFARQPAILLSSANDRLRRPPRFG